MTNAEHWEEVTGKLVSLRKSLQTIHETGPKALSAMANDLIAEIDRDLSRTVTYYQTLDPTVLTAKVESLMTETEQRILEIECEVENMEAS